MTLINWQPSASIENLRLRAAVIARIRQFFQQRNVLEVETPLLCEFGVTDPNMPMIMAQHPYHNGDDWFLQSSPEYAMKRLLAAGSGCIFQICKAFRRSEYGARHNPEFTLLEWYRVGFSLDELITELDQLLQQICQTPPLQQFHYYDLLNRHFNRDIEAMSCAELEALTRSHIDVQMHSDNSDDWLNLLFAECIEPTLGHNLPCIVRNYPASQAALATVVVDPASGSGFANRFELFWQGIEMANAYEELVDSKRLHERLQQESQQCRQQGQDKPVDHYLLAAAEQGMPACSGIALGLDRLICLIAKQSNIADVISFTHH